MSNNEFKISYIYIYTHVSIKKLHFNFLDIYLEVNKFYYIYLFMIE